MTLPPPLYVDHRQRFMQRAGTVLESVGAEYVFLERPADARGDPAEDPLDSDVDVAVAPGGRRDADAAIRLGLLGRVVQRFDYDVPFARYYVLRPGGEHQRRYRQIDLVSDPRGIGKYGVATSIALEQRVQHGDLWFPTPNAFLVYIAAKRAIKGLRCPDQLSELRQAYHADPQSGAELLRECYGESGLALAAALERSRADADIADPLHGIRHAITRHRSLDDRVRRGTAQTARYLQRALRPTGLLVTIVGPDGTGKSTLAGSLVRETGPFRRVGRYHFRPGILPHLSGRRGRVEADTNPHDAPRPSGVQAAARVGYIWADNAIGWMPRVWVPKRRSAMVIVERGWLDMAVDPVRYRFQGAARLVRWLSRATPRPDVCLLLAGAQPLCILEIGTVYPGDRPTVIYMAHHDVLSQGRVRIGYGGIPRRCS